YVPVRGSCFAQCGAPRHQKSSSGAPCAVYTAEASLLPTLPRAAGAHHPSCFSLAATACAAASTAAAVSSGRGLSRDGGVRNAAGGGVIVAWGVCALARRRATADKNKGNKPALSGAWGKKDGELKIEFLNKHVLKFVPLGDPAVIAIVCDYTVAKEGLVKA